MTVDSSSLVREIERWSTAVAYVARDETVANARADPRVPNGPPRATGGPKLRDSIRGDPGINVSGTTRTIRIHAKVIQAVTTEKGARPHKIVARRQGGYLAFDWPRKGIFLITRSVNHPGNSPHPWWEAVLRDAYAKALRSAARQVPF